MSELKRCAFCGGEATLCNYYFVQCEECGVSTLTFITKEEAIKAWNTRKPMQNIAERLEEYENEAKQLGVSGMLVDMIKVVKEEGGLNE